MIYFIQSESDPTGPVKIGVSTDPIGRYVTLQTAHHERLRIIRLIECSRHMERRFHDLFADKRIRGEWFRFDPDMLTAFPPGTKAAWDVDLTSNEPTGEIDPNNPTYSETYRTMRAVLKGVYQAAPKIYKPSQRPDPEAIQPPDDKNLQPPEKKRQTANPLQAILNTPTTANLLRAIKYADQSPTVIDDAIRRLLHRGIKFSHEGLTVYPDHPALWRRVDKTQRKAILKTPGAVETENVIIGRFAGRGIFISFQAIANAGINFEG